MADFDILTAIDCGPTNCNDGDLCYNTALVSVTNNTGTTPLIKVEQPGSPGVYQQELVAPSAVGFFGFSNLLCQAYSISILADDVTIGIQSFNIGNTCCGLCGGDLGTEDDDFLVTEDGALIAEDGDFFGCIICGGELKTQNDNFLVTEDGDFLGWEALCNDPGTASATVICPPLVTRSGFSCGGGGD